MPLRDPATVLHIVLIVVVDEIEDMCLMSTADFQVLDDTQRDQEVIRRVEGVCVI